MNKLSVNIGHHITTQKPVYLIIRYTYSNEMMLYILIYN